MNSRHIEEIRIKILKISGAPTIEIYKHKLKTSSLSLDGESAITTQQIGIIQLRSDNIVANFFVFFIVLNNNNPKTT